MPLPYHIPALLPEAIESLNIQPNGIYVDVTFGGGGHSKGILLELSEKGKLFSFDQDIDALQNEIIDERVKFIHGNFRYLRNFLRFYGINDNSVDGIIADLGVSFHHFDEPSRGFSYRTDGPLDMRMNRESKLTAENILNDYTQEDLDRILNFYGEVTNFHQVTKAIIKHRDKTPLRTTYDFLTLLETVLNQKNAKKELAKIFQALRIEVNDELGSLKELLQQSLKVLKPGGRIAIISYHSLEDRLIKNFFKTGNFDGKIKQDFFGKNLSPFKIINTKPIVASENEVSLNPRSRSAKLRLAEKL